MSPEERARAELAARSLRDAGTGMALFATTSLTLAILGLAGVASTTLLAITEIAQGCALLSEVGALSSHRKELLAHAAPADARKLSFGRTLELAGGAVAIALGVLSLAAVAPTVLDSTAAVVLGASLVVGTTIVIALRNIPIPGVPGEHFVPHSRGRPLRVVDMVAGLGAITLGILGLSGVSSTTLGLVSRLLLGSSMLAGGAMFLTRGGELLSRFRAGATPRRARPHRGPERPAPDVRPT